MPDRSRRTLLVASLIPLCWLAMQVVHEAGHVLAAWATGGTVTAVVLHPLAISRTDVASSTSPLAVVWGGPAFGVLAPVAAWLAASALRQPSAYLWRFFAGFCLVANGAYIGSGAAVPVGDAAELLRLGTPAWTLAAFGLVTLPAGLALWNGQGPAFGFGKDARPVSARQTWTTLALLAAIVAAELAWSGLTGFR
ncbi:MAG TPA: hypothetical protein VF170_00960 [Planctomycetaceae bacterium]